MPTQTQARVRTLFRKAKAAHSGWRNAATLPDEQLATLTADEIVVLAHRLILGTPPDDEVRTTQVARLESGAAVPADVLAEFVASPEFGQRMLGLRAFIRTAEPPPMDGLIDVLELSARKTVEQHNVAADAYFASRSPEAREFMLVKPFATPGEAAQLLTCFGHMIAALDAVRGMTVLDFGAGTGWTSWWFAQLGYRVIVSDVSVAALEIARERFRRWPLSGDALEPQFLVFDGHRFDLPDASVDRICCFDAFHHVINRGELMAELGRVLKPGGVAGFDEPGRYNSRHPQAQFEMREFGVVEGDVDLDAMAAMAEKAGLTFGGADVVTIAPVWANRMEFMAMAETGVLSDEVQRVLASYLRVKQLFMLRREGQEILDSRRAAFVHAHLSLTKVMAVAQDAAVRVQLTIEITNDGAAVWLPSDADFGPVRLGVRVLSPVPWETRATVHPDLPRQPGTSQTVTAEFDVPQEFAEQELTICPISEMVTWFDLTGTEPLRLRVADHITQ